jgi:4-amino-4-deoxy-L-arabinose transferase-like glycosyltransferase
MNAPGWARALVVLLIAGFVGLGALWIDRPGLQYDEALFVLASYPREDAPIAYMMHWGDRPVALMIISYLGALKGWLYIPILKLGAGSAALVRLPALVLGAAGLACLYLFARRLFGWPTGLLSVALAATDPIYLFTTRMDWGPVVIQRLCLLAGCWGVVRWWQKKQTRDLGLGCFAFGAGVFDKATFLWLLVALAGAAAVMYGRLAWPRLRPAVVAVALAAFLAGSAPFLYYCWKWPGETFRRESEKPEKYREKLDGLRYMLEGTALVGWFSRGMDGRPLDPPDAVARLIYRAAPREPLAPTLLLPAILAALLLLPVVAFTPWGRGMLFVLIFCLLALGQMLPVAEAGAIHHQALLLPFPHLFVSAGLLGARDRAGQWVRGWRRPAALSVVAGIAALLLVGANLRGVTHHYFRILAYGGGPGWSEAVYSLRRSLEAARPEKVLLLDWGIAMQLRLLTNDRLPVLEAPLPEGPSYDGRYLEDYLQNPNVWFVKYAAGEPPAFPQIAETFHRAAAVGDYQVKTVEAIPDLRGRSIYEILSVQPGPGPASLPGPPR